MVSEQGQQRLDSWLSSELPEGQHFEIKREVQLASPSEKRELLKDLTGMGNGGGGTVVFGLAEKTVSGSSVPDYVTALSDRGLLGRIENLVSSTVRPTLRWVPLVVEQPGGGFVLIVDVERSPLGPYMVEMKGEYRYWRRQSDSTVLIDERLVHDLYAEAVRWDADRAAIWDRLALPLKPTWSSGPWLATSGVPEYIDEHCFDPAMTDADTLVTTGWGTAHDRIAGLGQMTKNLAVWADGFAAEGNADRDESGRYPLEPQALLRVHRSAAVGTGVHLATPYRIDAVRALNAQLAYIGKLWSLAAVSVGEIRASLTGLVAQVSNANVGPYPEAATPAGTPIPAVHLRELVKSSTLADARERHRLIRRWANRLANAYGEPRQRVGFEIGRLHRPEGSTSLTAVAGWIHNSSQPGGGGPIITECGVVRPAGEMTAVGWWRDGGLLDLDGNLVACLEFATLDGLPGNFALAEVHRSEMVDEEDRTPEAWDPGLEPPTATATWLDQSAEQFLIDGPPR